MITAGEANVLAYKANEPERITRDVQLDSDISEILAKVKESAENGDYSLLINLRERPLKSDIFSVELKLKSLGFECAHTKIVAPAGRAIVDDLLVKWWRQ